VAQPVTSALSSWADSADGVQLGGSHIWRSCSAVRVSSRAAMFERIHSWIWAEFASRPCAHTALCSHTRGNLSAHRCLGACHASGCSSVSDEEVDAVGDEEDDEDDQDEIDSLAEEALEKRYCRSAQMHSSRESARTCRSWQQGRRATAARERSSEESSC